MAWMGENIPLFSVDSITYQCPNLDAGLAQLCQWKRSLQYGNCLVPGSRYTSGFSVFTAMETIPDLRPANERRRYKVTPSLIGWAQT